MEWQLEAPQKGGGREVGIVGTFSDQCHVEAGPLGRQKLSPAGVAPSPSALGLVASLSGPPFHLLQPGRAPPPDVLVLTVPAATPPWFLQTQAASSRLPDPPSPAHWEHQPDVGTEAHGGWGVGGSDRGAGWEGRVLAGSADRLRPGLGPSEREMGTHAAPHCSDGETEDQEAPGLTHPRPPFGFQPCPSPSP